MKVAIFFALVAAAYAGNLGLGYAPAYAHGIVAHAPVVAHAGIVNTGHSVSQRTQDGFGNYQFGYNEGHATGGSFRREAGNALGQVRGSYGLTVADGRRRIVNYVADGLGFRASVSTNEPGTAPSIPAHAPTNAAIAAPVAAIAAPVAHATVAHGYAAPIAAAHYGYGVAHAAPVGFAAAW
eukprot:TRINITY_DN1150_c0_g3_i1.p1 TRINITY_DN1150_c0_g3~~TRINITY_DN1150_c0_g3_i1.p1  ORF type:complete len:192 (+),score=31.47 TRINITY_DN1150_c0_g3_i1:36-578(+)